MSAAKIDLAHLAWRTLRAADLDAMQALHVRSMAGMTAEQVKPETRAFLDSLLRGRARVLGAWADDALIAYGVLQHGLLASDDPRALLGLMPERPLFKLAGSAVDARWRGLGLQRRLIAQRLAWAAEAPVFATAGPRNPASWRNLLAEGLTVRALENRYGGLARYLLARVSDEPFDADMTRARCLGISDLALQRALLEQGWQGVAAGDGDTPGLVFAPARAGKPS